MVVWAVYASGASAQSASRLVTCSAGNPLVARKSSSSGAVAQESFDDPDLGPTVAHVLDDWTGALAAVLRSAGHDEDGASDLAQLCVAAVEGAIILARVRRTVRPIEVVQERLLPLL